MVPTTRFAPSPTGFLHEGHAASALFAWQRARQAGGRFLLRMEDIDATRCRPAFAEAIEQDLAWLGLHWDGTVRIQSAHLPDYAAALARLAGEGLVYPCFCTRVDVARAAQAPHGPDGAPLYPGTCRRLPPAKRAERLAQGIPHAWRLDVEAAMVRTGPLSFHEAGQGRIACQPAAFGDAVLGRKNSPASYHLCVTHDDAVQGVTLVTRAEDLRPATSIHRVLQALLGWPEPGYAHHRLLHDVQGRRLAKRYGAPALRDLRAAGVALEEVLLRARSALGSG
jgi:glutamyl-Q tRNA(Asp) synthetase